LNQLNDRQLKNELIDSRDRIEQVIGSPCRLLAYPYGSTNPRVRIAASKVYDAAFGTRLAYASRFDDLHEIARIDAYYLRSDRAISHLIAGRWQGRLAVRRAMRAVRGTVERVILR
jgi:peptidoglycan/xylan/chitin deacetylase (PgdA/CDA1 family)